MKKVLSILLCFFLFSMQNLPVLAQTINLLAGTPITVYVDAEIDADDVQVDENINFIVQDPVYINSNR